MTGCPNGRKPDDISVAGRGVLRGMPNFTGVMKGVMKIARRSRMGVRKAGRVAAREGFHESFVNIIEGGLGLRPLLGLQFLGGDPGRRRLMRLAGYGFFDEIRLRCVWKHN